MGRKHAVLTDGQYLNLLGSIEGTYRGFTAPKVPEPAKVTAARALVQAHEQLVAKEREAARKVCLEGYTKAKHGLEFATSAGEAQKMAADYVKQAEAGWKAAK